jgi:hypothetical protein
VRAPAEREGRRAKRGLPGRGMSVGGVMRET